MNVAHVLLVEDDASLGAAVRDALEGAGHRVTWVRSGDAAAQAWTMAAGLALVVLDLGLPGRDGLEVLSDGRAKGLDTPVLVLTARDGPEDRVRGLDAGADDYLVKPFAFEELLARVEVLTARRGNGDSTETTSLDCHDLHMDLLRRRVTRAGQSIDLNPREFSLLEYLMRHADQVVTRTMLLEKVWDYHFDPQTNVIDVHISRLRQKIDKGHDRALIHTIRGAGYRLSPEQ